MSCPGCDAGIPWTWFPHKGEAPMHQWDDHKTVCERYLEDMKPKPVPDFKCYDPVTLDYNLLDPGVREVVRWLISKGFETSDSGDGKYKLEHGWDKDEIVPYPHVYMVVEPDDLIREATRLKLLLEMIGIDVVQAWTEEGEAHIECIYDPKGAAVIGLFNVTSEQIPGRQGHAYTLLGRDCIQTVRA